jgi:Rha family phage regulatory protein
MDEFNEVVNTMSEANPNNPNEEEQGLLPALGVTLENRRPVVSSRDIARVFEKGHYHVLRDIRELDCSEGFHESNFGFMSETVAIGKGATREDPVCQMTKNGFVFLVMGYTGKLAAQFKEAYIAEFDRMEEELNGSTESRIQAIAAEEAQKCLVNVKELVSKEVKRQTEVEIPIPFNIHIDPAGDEKNKKRLRVLHMAEQIPAHVPIGEWYEKLAEAEDISVQTIYRWISEARAGKVSKGKSKPYFSIHVTAGEIEFDIRTKAFCPEAVKWFLDEWSADPDLNVKETYGRLSEVAKEKDWKIGALASLYREKDQIVAAIQSIEKEAE